MTKSNMILERNDNNMSRLPSDLNSNQSTPSMNPSPASTPTSSSRGENIIPDWAKGFAKKFGTEFLVLAICGFLAWTFTPLKDIMALPDEFREFSSEVNTSLDVLQAQYNMYSTRVDSIDDRLYDLNGQVRKTAYSPSDGMIYKIEHTLTSRNSCSNDASHLVDVMVYDDNGIEYTPEEIAAEKLLLSYRNSDGQDVFFYGQLDKSGMWDGHCIVNIYENRELALITDAEYTGGKLITYKQVFPDVTTGKKTDNGLIQDDIWVISDRINMDGFSQGETWHYFRDDMLQQGFETADISAEDILSVQDFKESHQLQPEGYYFGNISNKRFNDNTGNSYLVKFFEDGTVETLYFGNFVNGQFDDKTGNAWMIGKKQILQEAYAYYKGNFSNGTATENRSHWKYSITQEFIDGIIEGKHFGCELKWEAERI